MENPQMKSSPFPPADQVPLHRAAPLAPSQELAYRRKCIQLRRRLTEIEANNDLARRRVEQEKNHINKMRLNRAILLNHLKELAEVPSRKLSKEEISKLANADGPLAEKVKSTTKKRKQEELLDEDLDETEDEVPKPQERPTRFRRTGNPPRRESTNLESTSAPAPAPPPTSTPVPAPSAPTAPLYPGRMPRVGLPTPPGGDPTMLYTVYEWSINGGLTPITLPYPLPRNDPLIEYQDRKHGQIYPSNEGYPILVRRPFEWGPGPAPERPQAPFDGFVDHMTPQLQVDYPPEQIMDKVKEEWRNLSDANRALWVDRYDEQMREYQIRKDKWEKHRRAYNSHVADGNGTAPVSTGPLNGPPSGADAAPLPPPPPPPSLQPRYSGVSG